MTKLKELDQDYLLCRLMRSHAWEPVDIEDLPFDPPIWGIQVALCCTRCGAYRLDVWNRMGEVTYRRYAVPDGYQVQEAKKLRAADYRKEYMRRHK